MRKIILFFAVLFSFKSYCQDLDTMNKMRSCSKEETRFLADMVINDSGIMYEFLKDKTNSNGDYICVYIPVGLNEEQKKELAANRYNDGIIVRFSTLSNGRYCFQEFTAKPVVMFSFVKKVFYPNITFVDFSETTKYRDYIDQQRKLKFYFYSGDSQEDKYRFYNRSDQVVN